jgi:S-adenosylmethionine synthetase
MARYVAKNVVAARSQVQLAYAIGVAAPVSVRVDTFGTGVALDEEIAAAVEKVFNLTPKGIIEVLQLRRPIYRKTTNYGHFGREEPEFVWERIDKVEPLRQAVGIK